MNAVLPNKTIYLSAKCGLHKVALEPYYLPFPAIGNLIRTSTASFDKKCAMLTVLETAESFGKSVSKERFLKLQGFALKMHSMFANTCLGESTFSTTK